MPFTEENGRSARRQVVPDFPVREVFLVLRRDLYTKKLDDFTANEQASPVRPHSDRMEDPLPVLEEDRDGREAEPATE